MRELWLTCRRCSKKLPIDQLKGRCECGGTLLVEYDLEKIGFTLKKESLKKRSTNLWRYQELLPLRKPESIVSLGEGWTPLVRMWALEKKLPLGKLWIKREEQNPTGSFKARGFSVAVSLLNERGYKKVAVPSNGNAASALAAYAAFAGMEAYVFVPMDTPGVIVQECVSYGAHTYLVDGFIHDASRIILDGISEQGWFHVGTLKEPGRVEGKKTMGLELAEQFEWDMPDVIIYPTGGGSGIVGMWKAFRELKELGFINGKLPRLVSVQEEGCQPIVNGLDRERRHSASDPSSVTSAPTGMRVPDPPDKELILSILREMNGSAVAVTREEIESAQKLLGTHGVSSSPEGAATMAALLRLSEQGYFEKQERVVIFNTSHALKYLPCTPNLQIPVVASYRDWLVQYKQAKRVN